MSSEVSLNYLAADFIAAAAALYGVKISGFEDVWWQDIIAAVGVGFIVNSLCFQAPPVASLLHALPMGILVWWLYPKIFSFIPLQFAHIAPQVVTSSAATRILQPYK